MKKSILSICIFIVIIIAFTFILIIYLDKDKNYDNNYTSNNSGDDENKKYNDNVIDAFVIKDNKLYVTHDGRKTLNEVTDFENLETGIRTLYIDDKKVDGVLYLYKKLSDNITYILIQTDMAMSTMCIDVYKTEDGGKNYTKVNVNQEGKNEGFLSIKKDAKIEFVNNKLIYISDPFNGGDQAKLYMSNDGLENVNVLDVLGKLKNNETNDITWEELYDYYNIPVVESNIMYLNITQGNDNDVGPYKYIKFKSEDNAKTWDYVGEFNDKSVYE